MVLSVLYSVLVSEAKMDYSECIHSCQPSRAALDSPGI